MHKNCDKKKTEKIYTSILILIIVIICFETGFNRATTVDYYPINGDFQNYNVWRRFLDGQIPFKEFPVYLGTGHMILGSLFTNILGNSFKMSLIVSHALTVAISASIIALTSYIILRNKNIALSNTVAVLVIVRENFTWFPQLVYSEIWVGINAIFYPWNSARIIRSGVVVFNILGVLLTLLVTERLYVNSNYLKNRKILIQSTCFSIISGLGILYSNDVGISSYIAFSLVYLILLVKNFGVHNIKMILKYSLYYIFVSLLACAIMIFILTRGEVRSWFDFTVSASQYQGWYYGNTEFSKTYSIFQIGLKPLYVIAVSIILICVNNIFNNREES